MEFGIIPEISTNEAYTNYEPQKYNCIKIDDDLYIDSTNIIKVFWEYSKKLFKIIKWSKFKKLIKYCSESDFGK